MYLKESALHGLTHHEIRVDPYALEDDKRVYIVRCIDCETFEGSYMNEEHAWRYGATHIKSSLETF